MSTTNPVSKVLVTSGNQAVLGAGNRIDQLANGQIGFFNFHTGLSVDGTVPGDARDIIIAVGINRSGGSTYEDHRQQAGQVLQVRHSKSYTVKPYRAGRPKIVDIVGFTAQCESPYALRVAIRNSAISALVGFDSITKVFSARTGCCPDQCAPCGTSNPAELATALIKNINLEPDKLLTATGVGYQINATVTAGSGATASITVTVGTTAYTVPTTSGNSATLVAAAIANTINTTANSPYRATNAGAILTIYPTTTGTSNTSTFALTNANGTGVTVGTIVAATKTVISNPDTFVAAYPGVAFGIRITSGTLPINSNNNPVNLKYHKLRETDFDVALTTGFTCNGTVQVVQTSAVTEGNGYDLKQEEYLAEGWAKPGPYRQSEITGFARDGFESFLSNTANYSKIALTYDQKSVGGWLEYYNNLETVIAVPCADTTTLTGIVAITDLIFSQFQAFTNDVTGMNCVSGGSTSALAANVDGIESLA